MVVRIGVIGEQLKAVVAVDTLRTRASDGVGKRLRRDVLAAELHRVRHGSVLRLKRIARFTKVRPLCPDVTDLKHPLTPQGSLDREVPLLRTGHDEVARNRQAEDAQSLQRPGASGAGSRSINGCLIGVVVGKTL